MIFFLEPERKHEFTLSLQVKIMGKAPKNMKKFD